MFLLLKFSFILFFWAEDARIAMEIYGKYMDEWAIRYIHILNSWCWAEDAKIAMEIYCKCKDEWERSVAAFKTSAASRIKKRKRP